MKLFLTAAFAAAIAFSSSATIAQSTVGTNPALAHYPTKGLWLSDAKPNHGWNFDVTATGFMLITIFTYDDAGQPTFLTTQGDYVETPLDPDGNVGRYTGGVFRTAGGAPIDSTATPAATATQVGDVEITFQSGRRAKWKYGANTFDLYSFQDLVPVDGGYKLPEMLVGRWIFSHTRPPASPGQPPNIANYLIRVFDAGTLDGKRIFHADCIDQCVIATGPGPYQSPFPGVDPLPVLVARDVVADLRFTYDPMSGELRTETRGTLGIPLLNNEILVVSPSEMQTRAYLVNGMPSNGLPASQVSARSFRFLRVPDDFLFGF